jgi:long-chain acyl-CoA synthetase
MAKDRLILDYVYEHANRRGSEIYLTQPLGGGQVEDYTWSRVLDEAGRVASHLKAQGFEPGARIAILSKNCAQFIIAELAIWMAGGTTVAIFPTESADTIRYVLEHSEASLLFVGKLDTWERQKPGVPEGLPRIAFPLAPASARAEYPTWEQVIAGNAPLADPPRRAADELAMLIYTSGSTGTPKGVMVCFEAFTRAAEGIVGDLRKRIGAGQSRMLSYLPLAHSFERSWVEASSLVDGRTRVYFADSLDTFLEDLRRARPTMFISVPRLWLKFQQGVFAKMPPAKLDRLLSIPIVRGLVAKKVLTGLGLEQVVQAGSGSAPLPADLIRWYRRLGLFLFEGYGMTEDSSYSHTCNEQFSEPGYVGVPMPGVEAKISAEGEILIKSPGCFSGYYKQPELTAECFTEDGFFRTGDLGEQRPDGMLKITGRAKELFKTAKGKYVAPAPIENKLNMHPMVEIAMVSGVGQPAAYGLLVLEESLRARQDDPAVRQQVEAELGKLLKDVNASVAEYEQLAMLVVSREPWTIENRCLTPTMKLKRGRVETLAAPRVEEWYAAKRPVVWA